MSRVQLDADYLIVRDGQGVSYGGQQDWYPGLIQRWSGCGPTTASTLTMCRERVAGGPVYTRDQFVNLMEKMWTYVTPGARGVDNVGDFMAGYDRWVREQGWELQAHFLAVNERQDERPDGEQVAAFLQEAVTRGCAVAFLNLDHGRERRLESWHWVALVGVEFAPQTETLTAMIADGGRLQEIDLGLWLATTTRGGGWVYYDRKSAPPG